MSGRTVVLLTVASTSERPQGVGTYSAALAQAVAGAEFETLIWSQRTREVVPRRVFWRSATVREGAAPLAMPVWRPGAVAGLDLLRQIRRTRPALLHVQFEFGIYGGAAGLGSMLLALLLARLIFRQRTVVTIHQVPSSRDLTAEWLRRSEVRLPPWAARRVIRFVVAVLQGSSDRLVVHADVFRDRLLAEWGVRRAPVVVPHGITFVGRSSRRDESRLLLFGYLKWYKGVEIAIEAFRRVAGEFPAWTLTIAGPAGSDRYLAVLRDLARPLGSRVEFLGPVDEEYAAELFGTAGIVLLPYRTLFSASGPLALAAGAQAPFIISEGLRPLCPDWPHWAPADPDAWARVMRLLMGDASARAAACRLATALATTLQWPVIADRTREIYRALLN